MIGNLNKSQLKILIALPHFTDHKKLVKAIRTTRPTFKKNLDKLIELECINKSDLSINLGKVTEHIEFKKVVDPALGEFLKWWKWAYWKKTGSSYKVNYGIDTSVIKNLLGEYDMERMSKYLREG